LFIVRYTAVISPNHIRLTNCETGESVARTATRPFSSEHRMIADGEAAASFLGGLIREVEESRRWLRLWPTIEVAITGELRGKPDQEEVRVSSKTKASCECGFPDALDVRRWLKADIDHQLAHSAEPDDATLRVRLCAHLLRGFVCPARLPAAGDARAN
jgi:hypothetical protein